MKASKTGWAPSSRSARNINSPCLAWQLAPRQHFARSLARAEAFVITVFLREVAALIEIAAFLAANDHCHGALADGDLGVDFVGLHQIDLARVDEHVARLANLGVVARRAT